MAKRRRSSSRKGKRTRKGSTKRTRKLTGTDGGAEDFKALLAKQETRIKELEGQIADAA